MISFFRRTLSSKLVLALLALVMIAFIITGVGSPTGVAGGGDRLASVEGESITATEMTDQINRQLERARAQQPTLDVVQFLRGGAFEEILTQLIGQKALTWFGRDQGLAASKRMIDGDIASIPAFQNLAGQFDQAAFQRALQSENIGEAQLRDDIATSIIQRQLLLPVAGSAKVPQAVALQYASLLLEQRSGSVGLVPAQAFAGGPAPTPAEVAAFYRANQGRYTAPERRVLRYATFGPEQVAAAGVPSAAEVQAFYTANAAAYGPRETRTLSQVVLPDQAAARAFAARLASGTSFAEAARQAGFGPSDTAIGAKNKAEFATLTSAAVANAAFAAAQGATTAPTQSDFGWHIVRVDAVETVAARPLAAVRDEIARQLGAQKREEALATLVARVEDALGDGSSFDEVARAERLNAKTTPPLTATGIQFDNPGFRAPELAPLLKTAFEMGPDEDPVVETLPGGQFAMLAVERVIAAAPPPLAQIADQVRGDFAARRALDRARALAERLAAKIAAGAPAREAFAAAGVPLRAPESVSARRIDIAQANQQVPPPLAMLFSLAKGRAKLLAAPDGAGWFVVHLATTAPGDAAGTPGLIAATRTQFERLLGEEYAAQFSRAIEGSADIERDAEAIARAKRALAGPGAQ